MTESASQPVFRFAPSPNGYLHIGHAWSALYNQRLARESGGRFLLRIEDIDAGRCRREYDDAIREDLAWLGVTWEEPVRRQSEHFDDYARALRTLRDRGVAYPCFCSRAEVARAAAAVPDAPRDPDGAPLYPGTCRGLDRSEIERRLASGREPALRLDLAAALALIGRGLSWREFGEDAAGRVVAAEPGLWGDAVIGRRDTPASYHIAVVVDDALQGVTDVARGRDLFHATGLHRLLQELLGLPAPRYRHHALLLDEAGAKLSKSARSKSLRALRAEGAGAAEVRARLGFS